MTRESSSPESESHVKRGLTIVLSAVLIGSVLAAGIGSVGAATAANSPEEAVFEVDSAETNAPITVGETFETTMVVTNTGNQTATKEVWFELGPHLKDDTQVELAPGETTTVELSWNSTENSDGSWELTAATPDDSVSRMVTIEEANSDESDESNDSDQSDNSDGSDESTDADQPAEADETDQSAESNRAAESTGATTERASLSSPSFVDDDNSLPETVTVDGTTVPTMPPYDELVETMKTRDDGAVGYDYTSATAELDGNETTVVLVDVDDDGTPEMAFVDQDGDGTVDPTRGQFHALYPEVNWGTWKHLVA